jgi:hypothetical protein
MGGIVLAYFRALLVSCSGPGSGANRVVSCELS